MSFFTSVSAGTGDRRYIDRYRPTLDDREIR